MQKTINGKSHVAMYGLLLIMLAAFSYLFAAETQAQQQDRSAAPDAQFTSGGTEDCLACHAGEAMTVMGETPHGDADNPHSPYATQGCESCHGPGSWHISRARGGAGFPPLLGFHIDAATADPDNPDQAAIAEMSAACTNCHAKTMDELEALQWDGSVHADNDVTCVNCHTGMHSLETPMADRAGQLNVCTACHENEITEHSTFDGKGIMFDKLTCYDCHDVHQLIGAE